MQFVEIERVSEDLLTVEKWRFLFVDRGCRLVLDTYSKLVKPTKRHGFKVVEKYDRLNQRDNRMPLDEVPFDDDIAVAAYNKFIEQIRVVKAW